MFSFPATFKKTFSKVRFALSDTLALVSSAAITEAQGLGGRAGTVGTTAATGRLCLGAQDNLIETLRFGWLADRTLRVPVHLHMGSQRA